MSKQDLKYIIDTISTNQVSEFEPGLVRNASVAAIVRWRPYVTDHILSYPLPATPVEFLNQSWINDCHGEAEILFIQRASHPTDLWSGHIAFPGGKDEPSDKSHLDTAIRECREEIGLDLASPHFIPLGTLEHRKITSLEGKKLIMTLVPHVFLQVSPITPEILLQTSEVAETYWISIRYLLQDPIVAYAPFIDANLKPGQKVPWPTSVRVPAVQFKTATESSTPHLWGMTLRMTQDIVGMKPSRTYMTEEEYKEFKNKQAKL
ncbi:NUDIX hydrolase domain-like protein [Helicostylum pulchrum]|nr:NUDIX hydrolase domain-like protein [Helicostylum pulchrum]